jgi:hypothetical protein
MVAVTCEVAPEKLGVFGSGSRNPRQAASRIPEQAPFAPVPGVHKAMQGPARALGWCFHEGPAGREFSLYAPTLGPSREYRKSSLLGTATTTPARDEVHTYVLADAGRPRHVVCCEWWPNLPPFARNRPSALNRIPALSHPAWWLQLLAPEKQS